MKNLTEKQITELKVSAKILVHQNECLAKAKADLNMFPDSPSYKRKLNTVIDVTLQAARNTKAILDKLS